LEIDWPLKFILILILLIFSAFFSGSEVALFSLDEKKVEKNFKSHPLISKYISSLLSFPKRLLVTILVGNTLVNVSASIIGVMLAVEYSKISGLGLDLVITIQIIILTILILAFGELTPKVIASRSPIKFSFFVSIPLYWISLILYPVAKLIATLIIFLTSKIKPDKSKTAITKDEISELAEISQEQGAIEEEEQEIISSLFEFKSVPVSEIMTPRVDIIAIPHNSSYKDLISKVTETGHSRLPVYKDDLDTILGIVYAKDLLPFIKDEKLRENLQLTKIARNAIFVPEIKKINDMLYEFQEKKMHIAIVVDEYGGTSGLVTLEDVIEEVVGEIWDEYDKEEALVQEIEHGKHIVLGKTTIDDLNEYIGKEILTENDNYDTVGGLVLYQAGRIPKEGFNFELDDYKFTVKEIVKKRVKRVLLEKI
jgi:gliding motility-associated protein GldE